ncbi:rod shape-determining protein MreD [Alkalithermobacter paradoxus]|uniref:Rod shape-determining protein MreD n=1 Tax=Alkalithermobacter paradoxus TaxID=29349 RepID=A0A1V4I6N1_9FIRM|nr:rod shape-determining protein MreD [[Clostridium] thermoalcaliphilum]
MKNFIVLLLGIIFIIFENSVLNYMPIFEATINLSLVYIIFISLSLEKNEGAIIGLVMGIFKDILVGRFLGLNGLIFFVVGYILGVMKDKIFKDNIITVLVLVVFSTIFDCAIQFLMASYFVSTQSISKFLYKGMILIPLLHVVFTTLIYRFLRNFIKRIDNI